MERLVPDIRRSTQAVSALLSLSLATATQYRSNFWFGMATGLFNDALRIAPLWIVYGHRDSVQGWELPEALLVLSFFLALSGVQHALFEPNLGDAVEAIRAGSLDLLLMKPVDSQLLVSLRRVDPTALWNFISAGAVGLFALSSLGWPTFLDATLAAALFGAGVAAMYGLWLLAICASFIFVRVDNLRFLLWSASDAGRWPIDVFGGWVRFVLTAVVPVALITSFPAQALVGRWNIDVLLQSAFVTILFVGGSRWMWKRSIARYTSASS